MPLTFDHAVASPAFDGLTPFATHPLCEQLPGVQVGRVLQVPGLVDNGGNHDAARTLLNTITEVLA